MQSKMDSGQCLKQPERQLSDADFVSALFDKGDYTAVVGAGRELLANLCGFGVDRKD